MNYRLMPAAIVSVGETVIGHGEVTTVMSIVVKYSTLSNGTGWVDREVACENGAVRRFGHVRGGTYKGCEVLSEFPHGICFEPYCTVDHG